MTPDIERLGWAIERLHHIAGNGDRKLAMFIVKGLLKRALSERHKVATDMLLEAAHRLMVMEQ